MRGSDCHCHWWLSLFRINLGAPRPQGVAEKTSSEPSPAWGSLFFPPHRILFQFRSSLFLSKKLIVISVSNFFPTWFPEISSMSTMSSIFSASNIPPEATGKEHSGGLWVTNLCSQRCSWGVPPNSCVSEKERPQHEGFMMDNPIHMDPFGGTTIFRTPKKIEVYSWEIDLEIFEIFQHTMNVWAYGCVLKLG